VIAHQYICHDGYLEALGHPRKLLTSVFIFYKLRPAEVSFSIKPGAPGANDLVET
jgi:hypothetical protein